MTDTADARRPHPWEAHYPEGVRWDVPLTDETVPDAFAAAVARYADKVAISYRGPDLTYDALGRRVWQVANALAADGFGRGDTLALYLPNTLWHPFFFYGALAAGGRVAHLSALDPYRVLAHKVTDSGSRTLVTINLPDLVKMALHLLDEGVIERVILCDEGAFGPFPVPLAPLPERAGVIDAGAFLSGAPETRPERSSDPDDVALLQYTGGTTGLPKGAMLSHRNLVGAVRSYNAWTAQDPALAEEGATLCVLPLFHIYALAVVLMRTTETGGRIVLRMRFDPDQAFDDIETHKITYFPAVPTIWIAMAAHPGMETRDISSLTNAGSGGAPLPVEVGRRFESKAGLPLLGGWGMTETCGAGTSVPEGAQSARPGTIGVPLPGMEMRVVDHGEPTRPLPPGEVGEIAIRGVPVTAGYWNRHDATAASHVDGWFLTGDMGRMDEDGFFYLVDRKSDLIISSGFNVYPQMIEQAVYEHPDVAECSVIGVPDGYRGESAKAFVTLKAGAAPFSLEALQAFLEERLGRHEMPRALEFRDALPRTPVGKLSRKELRDEEAAKREAAAAE